MKPVNAILENTGDFTSGLTDNAHVHKKYVDTRKNADEIVASAAISAFDPVTIDGDVCDSNNLAHRAKFAGIAEAAIAIGFSGLVQYGGKITNVAWSWSAGDRIFINGTSLSSIAPVTGWLQCIGTAINANEILVNLETSILL